MRIEVLFIYHSSNSICKLFLLEIKILTIRKVYDKLVNKVMDMRITFIINFM